MTHSPRHASERVRPAGWTREHPEQGRRAVGSRTSWPLAPTALEGAALTRAGRAGEDPRPQCPDLPDLQLVDGTLWTLCDEEDPNWR